MRRDLKLLVDAIDMHAHTHAGSCRRTTQRKPTGAVDPLHTAAYRLRLGAEAAAGMRWLPLSRAAGIALIEAGVLPRGSGMPTCGDAPDRH